MNHISNTIHNRIEPLAVTKSFSLDGLKFTTTRWKRTIRFLNFLNHLNCNSSQHAFYFTDLDVSTLNQSDWASNCDSQSETDSKLIT